MYPAGYDKNYVSHENKGTVNRRPQIPRQGRSPDFVHRCFSLPGKPVVLKNSSLTQ